MISLKQFLEDNAESIRHFKAEQDIAFQAERQRWEEDALQQQQQTPPRVPSPQPLSHRELDEIKTNDESNLFSPLRNIRNVASDPHLWRAVLSKAKRVAVSSPLAGAVWSVLVTVGERVSAGQRLLLIESMKTEVAVETQYDGVVSSIQVKQSQLVEVGQALILIIPIEKSDSTSQASQSTLPPDAQPLNNLPNPKDIPVAIAATGADDRESEPARLREVEKMISDEKSSSERSKRLFFP